MYDSLIDKGLIGTDEAGKGDYFGPLVCAACYVDSELLQSLTNIGIRDSKKISNNRIIEIAAAIKNVCPHIIIAIGPEKYNELYAKMKNLNKLLAWAHAKAIENLLEKVACTNVLIDKFGNETLMINALHKVSQKINLLQEHKAESNIAVAAASILARAEFLYRLKSLSKKYDVALHPGAGAPTDKSILKFANLHGENKLSFAAKVHFKNTQKVLG